MGWDGMQFPMGIAACRRRAVGNHVVPSRAATVREGGKRRRGGGTLKAFTTPERPSPTADVKMITRDFSLESPLRREML